MLAVVPSVPGFLYAMPTPDHKVLGLYSLDWFLQKILSAWSMMMSQKKTSTCSTPRFKRWGLVVSIAPTRPPGQIGTPPPASRVVGIVVPATTPDFPSFLPLIPYYPVEMLRPIARFLPILRKAAHVPTGFEAKPLCFVLKVWHDHERSILSRCITNKMGIDVSTVF